MQSSLFRAIGVLALLACFFAPSSARPAEPISPPPGSAERVAKMEVELKAMQEEAAKDPSRPSIAELRRELGQMAAERNAEISRRSKVARLERWLTGSFGLNLALALAILWTLARRGGTPKAPPVGSVSGT